MGEKERTKTSGWKKGRQKKKRKKGIKKEREAI